MKRNIKKFLFPAVAVAALSLAACSDWTETESLDINYPSLEEQNPELYKQYLQALRDYKAGEHKVVFVSMDNTTSAPAQRNEHLTTMPDSVDIICLMNPDNLHPTLAGEFAKVREKGTRVIYNIDYNAIEKLWEKVLADEEANKPEEPAAPDTPEADALRRSIARSRIEQFLSFPDEASLDKAVGEAARMIYDVVNAEILPGIRLRDVKMTAVWSSISTR